MVRREGSARFGDHVRHGDPFGAAHGSDGVDHVVSVFPHRVVHAGRPGGAGAVVVHAQTAAHIHVAQVEAHAPQLGVIAADLLEPRFHETDVGDLTAEMEVHQLENV